MFLFKPLFSQFYFWAILDTPENAKLSRAVTTEAVYSLTDDVVLRRVASLNNWPIKFTPFDKGWFQKKKKLMEFSIKGPDPPSQHP